MPRLSTRIANIFRSTTVDRLGRDSIRMKADAHNPQADMAHLDAVYHHLEGIRPFGTELSKLKNMKDQLKAKLKPSDPGDDLSKTQIPGIVRRHGFFKVFTVTGAGGQGSVPLKRTRKEIEIHRNLEEHFRQIGGTGPALKNEITSESLPGGAGKLDPAHAATMLAECFRNYDFTQTNADAVGVGALRSVPGAHASTAIPDGPAAAVAPRAASSASPFTPAAPQKHAPLSAPDHFVWVPESFTSKAPFDAVTPIVAPALFGSSSAASAPPAPAAPAAPAVALAPFTSPSVPFVPPVAPASAVSPAPDTNTSAAVPSIDTPRFATVDGEPVVDSNDQTAVAASAADAAAEVSELAQQFADEARIFLEAAVAAARAAANQDRVADEIANAAQDLNVANEMASGFAEVFTIESQKAADADRGVEAEAAHRAELEQRMVELQKDIEDARNAESAKQGLASDARARAAEAARQAAERRAEAAEATVIYRQVHQRYAGSLQNL